MSEGTFLEAPSVVEGSTAVVLGIPYDGGISFRAGAREAPHAVRAASQSIETYSPRLRRDLADLAYADAGDLHLAGLDAAEVMACIADAVAGHEEAGRFVVSIGGDHSVSIGTTAGSRRVHEGLAHVVFDAHLDMRPEYDGSRFSHACGTRHMASAGPTVALGIRAGSREEFADADALLVAWSEDLSMPDAAHDALAGHPIHVSIDLDVLDPSILPGTGNPEPGGPAYRELRDAVLALSEFDVVAVDLVEVSPPWDASGISATVAAHLAREVLLGLGPGGA
jgi:agmatinase